MLTIYLPVIRACQVDQGYLVFQVVPKDSISAVNDLLLQIKEIYQLDHIYRQQTYITDHVISHQIIVSISSCDKEYITFFRVCVL